MNNGVGRKVLMDLSKAFETLNHDDLLIPKLNAYGFQHMVSNLFIVVLKIDGTEQKLIRRLVIKKVP